MANDLRRYVSPTSGSSDWVINAAALGTVNSTNRNFSTGAAYEAGSLSVYVNGGLLGSDEVTEGDPTLGTYQLSDAPIADGQQTDEVRNTYKAA